MVTAAWSLQRQGRHRGRDRVRQLVGPLPHLERDGPGRAVAVGDLDVGPADVQARSRRPRSETDSRYSCQDSLVHVEIELTLGVE